MPGLLKKALGTLRRKGVKRLAVKTAYFLRRRWNERRLAATFLLSAEALEAQRATNRSGDPVISLLVPLFDTPIAYLQELVASVKAQTYSAWELCLADGSRDGNPARADLLQELAASDPRIRVTVLSSNLGISGNTNAAIDLARGPFLALLDHDDLLPPHALHEVAKAFRETGADFVYTDEACFVGTPRRLRSVHFKPDFAPDTLRGNNYLCHLSAFRATLLDRVGRLDPACDGSQDYDLVLRLTEKAEIVAHVPKVCYFWRVHPGSVSFDLDVKPYALAAARRALDAHLARTGLSGRAVDSSVASTYRIEHPEDGNPLVSILLTSEAADLAESLEGSHEALLRAGKKHADLEVLPYRAAEGETRSSALDRAARASKGEYLVFLDPGLDPRSPDWVGEMVGFARRAEVAAVGARLLYAGGKVFGAGLVVQPGPRVLHASRGDSALYDGYMSRSTYVVDVTAVPLDCLMVRRDRYLATEGIRDFDGTDAAALDLCLQLTQRLPSSTTLPVGAARWVVCTPYVEFAFRGRRRLGWKWDAGELLGCPTEADIRRLVERWPGLATFHDPFYNPNLNAARADFTVRPPTSRPEVDE